MKKVLFFAPVLTLAIFFFSCQKDNGILPASPSDLAAGDRLNCGITLSLTATGPGVTQTQVSGAGGIGQSNYICPTSGGGITVQGVQTLTPGTYNLLTTDNQILLNARRGGVNYTITDSNGNSVSGTLAAGASIVYDVTGNCDVVGSACN